MLFNRIDASDESSSGLARFVNDAECSPTCNSKMKKVETAEKVHLCLFSTRDIDIGEEIRYDYGVKDLPWRQKVCL